MKRAAVLLCSLALALVALRAYRARPAPAQLLGLWSLTEAREVTDELRFYYFHEGGKGLYRYGQVGHNQTHSFDWSLEGDRLVLSFRKTGEQARTQILLAEEGGRRSLTLVEDPRGPGRVRYTHRPSNLGLDADALGGPLSLSMTAADERAQGALAGRMWMDLRRYATGGSGFVMYQLSEHELGGGLRLGWHHQGDFDDWSTESMSYREEPGALRLRFHLRREEAVTPVELEQARDRRVLTLLRDPRNFLHRTRLVDAGRSF